MSDTLPELRCRRTRFSLCRLGLPCPRPKPNPSSCFQTSFLTLLANKPSTLRILQPQRSPLPRPQEKHLVLRGCPETPKEDQPARPSTAPQLDRLRWARMLCLTQPEARRADRPGDSWPHTQHIGHAVALARPLFPSCVFRHLNLDVRSNPSTRGFLKH